MWLKGARRESGARFACLEGVRPPPHLTHMPTLESPSHMEHVRGAPFWDVEEKSSPRSTNIKASLFHHPQKPFNFHAHFSVHKPFKKL